MSWVVVLAASRTSETATLSHADDLCVKQASKLSMRVFCCCSAALQNHAKSFRQERESGQAAAVAATAAAVGGSGDELAEHDSGSLEFAVCLSLAGRRPLRRLDFLFFSFLFFSFFVPMFSFCLCTLYMHLLPSKSCLTQAQRHLRLIARHASGAIARGSRRQELPVVDLPSCRARSAPGAELADRSTRRMDD